MSQVIESISIQNLKTHIDVNAVVAMNVIRALKNCGKQVYNYDLEGLITDIQQLTEPRVNEHGDIYVNIIGFCPEEHVTFWEIAQWYELEPEAITEHIREYNAYMWSIVD